MSACPPTTVRQLGAVLCALVLAGCSSGGSAAGPPDDAPGAVLADPARPGPDGSAPACPVPADDRAAFPATLPADFPADFPPPAGALDAVADDSDPAVVSVRFRSTASLRDAVAFVLDRLPAKGFEITGGDREPHEADVVFARGAQRGQLRIARVDDCTTFWLVQVVRPGG